MSRKQELSHLKIFLDTGVVGEEVAAVAFVNILDKYDSLYHFDEMAEDIQTGDLSSTERIFKTKAECDVVNDLRNRLYKHDIMGLLVAKYEEREQFDDDVLKRADAAFWSVVADAHPEIKTGDLAPDTVMTLNDAQKRAYFAWIKANKVSKS